jgi:hypothetical protein
MGAGFGEAVEVIWAATCGRWLGGGLGSDLGCHLWVTAWGDIFAGLLKAAV